MKEKLFEYKILLAIVAIIAGVISTSKIISLGIILFIALSIIAIICFRENKKYIFIFIVMLLIILNENFLHLSRINLTSIVPIVGLIVFTYRLKKISNEKYIFKNLIFSIILICLITQIGAYIRYGQNIILGIIGMNFIFIYLYYFYFVDIFYNKFTLDDLDKLINIIIKFATVLSIVYFIQAIIYPDVKIFDMGYSQRNGRTRFFTGYVFIMFSIILIYSKILESSKKNLYIHMIIQLFSLIFVSQTRNFILGIFIAILIGMIFSKNVNKTILVLVLGLFGLGIMIFNQENYITNMINEMMIEVKTKSGTIGARIHEFEFYMNLLKQSPILGIGILDIRFPLTPIITGYDPYFYYINDLGLIGVIIQCGILGGIWLINLFRKIYLYGKKCINLKVKNMYIMINTLVLLISLFASGLVFDKGAIIYICIFLAIGEVSYRKNS